MAVEEIKVQLQKAQLSQTVNGAMLESRKQELMAMAIAEHRDQVDRARRECHDYLDLLLDDTMRIAALIRLMGTTT